jgi:hypothetical protein
LGFLRGQTVAEIRVLTKEQDCGTSESHSVSKLEKKERTRETDTSKWPIDSASGFCHSLERSEIIAVGPSRQRPVLNEIYV